MPKRKTLPGGGPFLLSGFSPRDTVSLTVKGFHPSEPCCATSRRMLAGWAGAVLVGLFAGAPAAPATPLTEKARSMMNEYCVSCHDADEKKGGLDKEIIEGDDFTLTAAEC